MGGGGVVGSLTSLNITWALSQVRICRHPLSFAPIFIKDAHSAESNEKSIFLFLFFEL